MLHESPCWCPRQSRRFPSPRSRCRQRGWLPSIQLNLLETLCLSAWRWLSKPKCHLSGPPDYDQLFSTHFKLRSFLLKGPLLKNVFWKFCYGNWNPHSEPFSCLCVKYELLVSFMHWCAYCLMEVLSNLQRLLVCSELLRSCVSMEQRHSSTWRRHPMSSVYPPQDTGPLRYPFFSPCSDVVMFSILDPGWHPGSCA